MAKDTEFVLVETVSMFRMRYVVEVPKNCEVWALDSVTLGQAQELSQKHLDEIIVSHKKIKPKKILQMINRDNDYASTWSDEKKFEVFVTNCSSSKKE